jgi:hypothetical protein
MAKEPVEKPDGCLHSVGQYQILPRREILHPNRHQKEPEKKSQAFRLGKRSHRAECLSTHHSQQLRAITTLSYRH